MKHPIIVIRDENLEDVKFNVKECALAYYPDEKYPLGEKEFFQGSLQTLSNDYKGRKFPLRKDVG